MNRPNLLFNTHDIHDICRNLPESVKTAADALPDDALMDGTVDEVTDRLVAAHAIEVPTIDLANVRKEHEEVDVDVSGDPRRLTFGGGPCLVKGTKVVWRVPFQGTSELLHCRPSSFSLTNVHASVDRNAIVIEVIRTDHDAKAFKNSYDETINSIQAYLNTLRSDTARLIDDIRQAALSRIQQRREKRERDRALLDQL